MREFVDRLLAGVRVDDPAPGIRGPAARAVLVDFALGLGVTPWSRDGSLVLRCSVDDGALAGVCLGTGADASDIGGDGGSLRSETFPPVILASGGVVTSGELAVEFGDV